MRFALTNRDRFLHMGRDRGGGGGERGRFGSVRGDGSLRFSALDEPPPTQRSSGGAWRRRRGSLSPGVTASDLSEMFFRCSEVEGISREPCRSFAFVSFLREEHAVAALRELQGVRLHRVPIRIEFSKGVSVEHPPTSITIIKATSRAVDRRCDGGSGGGDSLLAFSSTTETPKTSQSSPLSAALIKCSLSTTFASFWPATFCSGKP